MSERTVPAAVFKAKCLALLDEVAATGQILIVTKRGKPVARILPPETTEDIRGFLKSAFVHVGDVEDTGEAWSDWDPEQGFRG
jgi:prevent-host-death family protein